MIARTQHYYQFDLQNSLIQLSGSYFLKSRLVNPS